MHKVNQARHTGHYGAGNGILVDGLTADRSSDHPVGAVIDSIVTKPAPFENLFWPPCAVPSDCIPIFHAQLFSYVDYVTTCRRVFCARRFKVAAIVRSALRA